MSGVNMEQAYTTEINFGDYWYQFVGAAFGSPYNNAEYQEDRRRRPLQFLSYIRPIILKIDLREHLKHLPFSLSLFPPLIWS